jgi:hypothetical protein
MRQDAIRLDDGRQVSSNGPLTKRISPARGNRRYSISESQMQFGKRRPKFPAPSIKFPARAKKFPAPLSREFAYKQLMLHAF